MATVNQLVSNFDDGFSVNYHRLRNNQLNNIKNLGGVEPVRANTNNSLNEILTNVQNPYKNYAEYLQSYAEEKNEFDSGLKGVSSQLGSAVDNAEQLMGSESILQNLRHSTAELEQRREISKEAAKDVAQEEAEEARREQAEADREQAAEERQKTLEEQQAKQAENREIQQEEIQESREKQAEAAAEAREKLLNAEEQENEDNRTVATDKENASALLQSVQQLVNGYNEATDFLADYRSVSGKLSALANSFNTDENDKLSSHLSQAGIDTDDNGRLSVNLGKLSNVLRSDPQMVESLLGQDGLAGKAKTQVRRMDFQKERLFPGPESKLDNEVLSGSKQLYTSPAQAHHKNPLKAGNFIDMSY